MHTQYSVAAQFLNHNVELSIARRAQESISLVMMGTTFRLRGEAWPRLYTVSIRDQSCPGDLLTLISRPS